MIRSPACNPCSVPPTDTVLPVFRNRLASLPRKMMALPVSLPFNSSTAPLAISAVPVPERPPS